MRAKLAPCPPCPCERSEGCEERSAAVGPQVRFLRCFRFVRPPGEKDAKEVVAVSALLLRKKRRMLRTKCRRPAERGLVGAVRDAPSDADTAVLKTANQDRGEVARRVRRRRGQRGGCRPRWPAPPASGPAPRAGFARAADLCVGRRPCQQTVARPRGWTRATTRLAPPRGNARARAEGRRDRRRTPAGQVTAVMPRNRKARLGRPFPEDRPP